MHCQTLLWCTFPLSPQREPRSHQGNKKHRAPPLQICSKQEKAGLCKTANTFFRVTSSSQVSSQRERGDEFTLGERRNEVVMPGASQGSTAVVKKNMVCMETCRRKHVKATLYKQGVAVIVLVGRVCLMFLFYKSLLDLFTAMYRNIWVFYFERIATITTIVMVKGFLTEGRVYLHFWGP